jgi:hypothetical protein
MMGCYTLNVRFYGNNSNTDREIKLWETEYMCDCLFISTFLSCSLFFKILCDKLSYYGTNAADKSERTAGVIKH